VEWADRNKKWDYGGEDNGLMLSTRNKHINEGIGDYGNQPNYDSQISERVKQITDEFIGSNPTSPNYEEVLIKIKEMNQKIKTQLKDNVINADFIVNTVELSLL
jgi:hypothetical protein